MTTSRAKRMLVAGRLIAIAAVIQVIGFIRYLTRLPDDTLGIWLHIGTIALLLIAATLFFIGSRRENDGDS